MVGATEIVTDHRSYPSTYSEELIGHCHRAIRDRRKKAEWMMVFELETTLEHSMMPLSRPA